jgi:hypothetical protein
MPPQSQRKQSLLLIGSLVNSPSCRSLVAAIRLVVFNIVDMIIVTICYCLHPCYKHCPRPQAPACRSIVYTELPFTPGAQTKDVAYGVGCVTRNRVRQLVRGQFRRHVSRSTAARRRSTAREGRVRASNAHCSLLTAHCGGVDWPRSTPPSGRRREPQSVSQWRWSERGKSAALGPLLMGERWDGLDGE